MQNFLCDTRNLRFQARTVLECQTIIIDYSDRSVTCRVYTCLVDVIARLRVYGCTQACGGQSRAKFGFQTSTSVDCFSGLARDSTITCKFYVN